MNNNALENCTFTKIIMGLGNTSLPQIKALGAIYSIAGVNMFDISPEKEAISALIEGIKSQNLNPDDFSICTSFSFGDDIHGSKAFINKEKCIKCGKCITKCPYNAIKEEENTYKTISDKCIGCRKCNICEAISYKKEVIEPLKRLKELKDLNINAIELHVNGLSKEKISEEVKKIKKVFPKIQIGLCMTADKRPLEEVNQILESVCKEIYPAKLIFQADGKAMSGTSDDYYLSKPAIDFAKKITKQENLYIIISGGCNNATSELIKEEKAKINGIAYGSFARILAEPYVKKTDFWCNIDVIKEAVEKCKQLNDNYSKKCT